jgi:hypothetical protein
VNLLWISVLNQTTATLLNPRAAARHGALHAVTERRGGRRQSRPNIGLEIHRVDYGMVAERIEGNCQLR